MRKPELSIRLDRKKHLRAKAIATANYTTFNGLVEMLIDAADQYADASGKMELPLSIVTQRDFQEFSFWLKEKREGMPADPMQEKQNAPNNPPERKAQ